MTTETASSEGTGRADTIPAVRVADSKTAATPPANRPGFLKRFGRALGRFLLALFKVTLLLILIGGVIVAGWFIFQELNRSFGVVDTRIDSQMEDIAAVRLDILALSGQLSEQQSKLAELDGDSETLNGRIAALNSDLTADITRQEELLTALTTQVEGLDQENGVQAESLTRLGEGLAALQSDLNSSNTEIDALGGDLDAASGSIASLTADLGAVQDALAQKEAVADKVSLSLSLFRIWEMVARARLQLADGNTGLAQADLEKAQLLLTAFLGEPPAETTDDAPALTLSTDLETALSIAYTRLGMAQENLDSSPETAVRDLDTAWEALDAALVILLEETAVANETAPPSN